MGSKRGRIFTRGTIFWIQYFFNGKDRRESTRSTKRKVAEKLLTKRLAGKDAGTLQESDLTLLKFEDLRAKIDANYLKKQNRSIDRMHDAWKALGTMFAGWSARAITDGKLDEYFNARVASGKARATVVYELAVLRRSFRLAKLPWPFCESIPLNNVRTGFFEWEEFQRVLAQLPVYLRPVMTVGYFTGWRVQSELLPLQWNRVNEGAGTITLDAESTKNNEPRTYPIGKFPELLSVFQTQRAAAKLIGETRHRIVPWVFFRITKTGVLPIKSYKTAWARATRAAGLPNLLVHDLRRTGVRTLRLAYVPENVAMKLTGHRTRSVFDRYNIVDERDQAVAVEQLAAFHARQTGLRDNYGTISPFPVTAKKEQHG